MLGEIPFLGLWSFGAETIGLNAVWDYIVANGKGLLTSGLQVLT